MWTRQLGWNEGGGWAAAEGAAAAGLVLYFGDRALLACGTRHAELRAAHPRALLLGCSTGGQIRDHALHEGSITGVALGFERTRLHLACHPAQGPGQSFADGAAIGAELAAQSRPGDALAGIFILSDGLNVNGSALVAGIAAAVGPGVSVSGGLAGDGAAFASTLVGAGDRAPAPGRIAAVGFYGAAIRFGHGSRGGWVPFGPTRSITAARGSVLMELDGAPALDLYERYLGDEAAGLPGSALLFPLRVWEPDRPEHEVVRTVVGVDHAARSMTFAGDIPVGWRAQLMRASFEQLGDAAAGAARDARATAGGGGPGLAILISCIGRRLIMGQRVGEEIEAATAELGPGTTVLGFYSYGELSPHPRSGECQLHNQTMTVTMLDEVHDG